MIKLIDTLSYTNKLRPLSPLWKSGFAAVLFVLSYLSHPGIQFLIALWMFVWTALYARIPVKFYCQLMGSACLFYAASLPAMVIEFDTAQSVSGMPHGTTLFTFAQWTAFVTESGMANAGGLLIRIAACLSCLLFVMLTTPMSQLFQVMKKLRMPSLILELMLIMYRFLFLLADTAEDIYTSQRARGGQTGFYGRLNDTAVLIVRLFAKTMKRYKDMSHGLAARGFTEEITMAPLKENAVPLRYKWESIIGITLLLLLEIWLRWGK